MQKRLVVIIAMPDSLSLDCVGPTDVFSCANQMLQLHGNQGEGYRVIVASATPELKVTFNNGLTIACETSIYQITEKIDTLLIAGFSSGHIWDNYPELIDWLKSHARDLRRICSVCIGAFVLAESGFLTGKRATTHWQFCKELSSAYEGIHVKPDPIFVKDEQIYTSAGASAGIDLSLALVEEDFGRKISLQVAQTLVLYLKRPGNQSQFSNLLSHQLSCKTPIRELQQWMMSNLKENLDVKHLSDLVAMSPRNFARVFAAETGLTPAKYTERLRIEASKRYLEATALSIDEIAHEAGFGSQDSMRKIFMRNLNTTPHEYRNLFGEI